MTLRDITPQIDTIALQRRLHTLLASAQLFEEPALVELLQRVVSRLDAVGLSGEPWREVDRQALSSVFSHLSGSADDVDFDVTSVTTRPMKIGISVSSSATAKPATNNAANRPFAWRA